jgi:SAM-dependent methyltransferase
MASPWNHNIHYHDLVLRWAGPGCRRALDVGCGQGLLARKLAERCPEVIAIDTDRDVISKARDDCSDPAVPQRQLVTLKPVVTQKIDARIGSIRFIHGDVMTHPFSEDSFDLISAVATLHHLELRPALVRFRNLLRPGGVLVVIGLYRGETLVDLAFSATAFPVSWILRSRRGCADVGAPVQNPKETLREIRKESAIVLPGAFLRRRLLFRYSLLWHKPSA